MPNKPKFKQDYDNLMAQKNVTLLDDIPPRILTKCRWRCHEGHEFVSSFRLIRKSTSNGCPYCPNSNEKNLDDYRIVIGKDGLHWAGSELPNNVNTKTWWVCSQGHKRRMSYKSIVTDHQGCAQCQGNSLKTVEDYQRVTGKDGLRWVGIEAPRSVKDSTLWVCSHGHRRTMSYWAVVYAKRGCAGCQGNARKTIEDYRTVVGVNGLRWAGENTPKNTHAKTVWVCPEGHKSQISYSDVTLDGVGCLKCQYSKGEEAIAQILDDLSIPYHRQKRFKECRYKNPLPFDFYLPTLNVLIEYDGEQHFRQVYFTKGEFYLTKQQLELIKIKDSIKDEFARRNALPLIRAPYTVKDIRSCLVKNLKPYLLKDTIE